MTSSEYQSFTLSATSPFRSAKMALQKAISKKMKSFYQEKIEKNAHNSKELWKALKSIGMKSSKVNQSKIAWKNDGAI